MRKAVLILALCLFTVPAMANDVTDAIIYNQLQQNQRIQELQAQQQQGGQQYYVTPQERADCLQRAYIAGQMAPKHGGGSLLEGYGQAAQEQAKCPPSQ